MFGKRDEQGSKQPPMSMAEAPATQVTSLPPASSYSGSTSSQNAQGKELNALLGKGSSFEGKLTFEGTVRIDGRFRGEIVAKDILIIGDDGVVDGDITVGEIISSGQIKGTIRAERAAEFLSPGKVEAEVFTSSLHIERGVSFDGQIHMKSQGDTKENSQKKSKRSSSDEKKPSS